MCVAWLPSLRGSHPGLRTHLTGQIVVDQAFPESTEGDIGLSGRHFLW